MGSVVSLSEQIRCPCCGYKGVERQARVCPSCGVDMDKAFSTTLKPGTIIGKHFEIDFILGQGGFGVTYQAVDRALQRRVAIKEYFPREWALRDTRSQSITVAPNHLDMYSRTLKKFEQEGQILANINHPGIVRVFSLFWDLGTVYLVMELLEGETLAHRLERGFEEQEIRHIMKSLVSALYVLHKQGVQHLDIKPDNIMLLPRGRVVLFDFGAARWDTTVEQNQQARTVTAYTPGYAPLELLQHSKAKTTAATDIFELNVVLYELITGQRPPDVLARLNGEPLVLQLPDAYRGWEKALAKGLEIQIEDRPQTVREWWRLVEGQNQSADLNTEIPGIASNLGINLPKLPSLSGMMPKLPSFGGIKRLKWFGITAVSIIVVGGGGLFLFLQNEAVQRYLATVAVRGGNYEQAIRFYDQLVQRNPGDASLWMHRGDAYFELKKYPLAIADYESSLRLARNPTVAHRLAQANLQQAQLDLNAGNHALALQRLDQAVKADESLAATVEQLVLNTYLGMAKSRVAGEDWQGAITVYAELLKRSNIDSKVASEIRQSLADVYYALGQRQEAESQFENAMISYNKGIENNPSSAKLYAARGNLLLRTGRFENALSQYNQAIELEPTNAEYWARRGFIFGRLAKYNEGLSDFNKAIELGLRNADVYNGRGWINAQLRSYGNALSDYNEALRMNPRLAMALVGRGWVKHFMGDYPGAIDDFNKALVEQANLAIAYHGLGYAKTMIRDDKATILADLNQAMRLYQQEGDLAKIDEIRAWIQKHKLEGS